MLLIAHAAITWFLAGVIWMIQVVHYPLFEKVSPADFQAFHKSHVRRMTAFVAPLMLLEGAAAFALAFRWPSSPLVWVGAGLLGLNWIITLAIHTPLHLKLGQERNDALMARLIGGNWIRTGAWSARCVCAAALLWPQG